MVSAILVPWHQRAAILVTPFPPSFDPVLIDYECNLDAFRVRNFVCLIDFILASMLLRLDDPCCSDWMVSMLNLFSNKQGQELSYLPNSRFFAVTTLFNKNLQDLLNIFDFVVVSRWCARI